MSRHTIDGSTPTYLFNSREEDRTYSFYVIPTSVLGDRGPFDRNGGRTITVPARVHYSNLAPSWLNVAMVESGAAKLTWSEPAQRPGQINGYRIYRRAYSPGDTRRIDQSSSILVVNTGATDREYTDRSMTLGQPYVYAVAARRDSYSSGVSMPSRVAYAQAWEEPEE